MERSRRKKFYHQRSARSDILCKQVELYFNSSSCVLLRERNVSSCVILQNSDCDKESTKHVDAFLYDNKELDELLENGEVINIYCADCLSEDVRQYSKENFNLSTFHIALQTKLCGVPLIVASIKTK